MKKIIFIYFIALTLFTSCNSFDTIPIDELAIVKIIEVQKTKSEIYDASMTWIAKTFISAKAVVEYQDKEVGKIIGKGIVKVTYSFTPVDTAFTMIFEVKENRVRVVVENPIELTQSLDESKRKLVIDRKKYTKFMYVADRMIEEYTKAISADSTEW